jgi:signal transduction histidine kinase
MGISMQDAISTAPACVGRTFGNWQQWRDATMPKDTEPSTVMASRSDADPDDADGSARLAMTGLRRELEQRAKQLETVTAALQQAEQRERSRLARILHDHLQQLIVAAQLAVAQAEQRLGLDEAVLRTDLRPLLGRADDLLRQSLTATRDLMAELDPPVLHAKSRPRSRRDAAARPNPTERTAATTTGPVPAAQRPGPPSRARGSIADGLRQAPTGAASAGGGPSAASAWG